MTFATKQRLLLGLAVIMMLAPTILYANGSLGRAPMFEGDTRQEMSCLSCGGLGKVKGEDKKTEEKCRTCYGRGFSEYILPGPNRPLQLVGTVKDPSGKPVTGADVGITEAGVKADPIVMKTNDDGQFGFKFPPGNFHLSFSVPENGKLKLEQDLKVERNPAPLPASGMDTLHKIEQTFTLQQ